MLQAIRDGVKGWIAWVVIGLIALPFVFMGGYDYFTGGTDRDAVVAKVGGEEIVRHELNRAVEQRRMQLREMFGGDLPEGAFDEGAMRREALQGLIDERLLHKFVADQNLRVSDEEVARTIRNQQIFHEGGQFSRDRYRTLLNQNRLTPEEYEEMVRQDLLVGQFEDVMHRSSFVASGMAERYLKLDREQRSFEYLELTAELFKDEVEITESELESYYEEHKDEYMAPEAVKLAYIEVREDELDDAAKIDNMANVAFERPESLEPAAEEVGADIRYSDWITQEGESDGLAQHSAIVSAAFSEDVLEYGYNSDLIEVSGGHFFVVRKAEHREAEPRPLSDVEQEVREQLRLERALDLARQEAEDLIASVEEDAEQLSSFAERVGAELFAVDGARRSDVSHPQSVVREAFRLGEGGVGKVELDNATVAVVRLAEVEPGDPDGVEDQELRQVQRDIEQMTSRADMQAFMRALRDDVSVKINEQRL
ncbi:peptidylprolyl isomerase [Halorhodospira halochloris]|uniref:peptidylprolyl isomerase n=1 Tax=Halorhodospira halochloris TaxID=1052 RepID=UPI001EE8E7A1|nr:peptidylprolyl isomerase [Halorhodospira halochloris]MCG5547995.1 SurA N-terminal domain-containing protein [Halorhodospira halochloris]